MRVLLLHAGIQTRGGVVNLESGGFDPIKAQNQSGFLALRARRRCWSGRYTFTYENRKVGLHLKAVSLYGCQAHRQFCHRVAVETPFGPELGKKGDSVHTAAHRSLSSLSVRMSLAKYCIILERKIFCLCVLKVHFTHVIDDMKDFSIFI